MQVHVANVAHMEGRKIHSTIYFLTLLALNIWILVKYKLQWDCYDNIDFVLILLPVATLILTMFNFFVLIVVFES